LHWEASGARPRRARSYMTKPYPSHFMNQLVSAMTQLSSRLPSFPCRVLAYRESVPSGLCGSYVSLSGERTEHIVGLLSHPLGWEALSCALDHDSPLPEPRGLVEGACEIGKIVAEAFRSSLPDAAGAIVGLPLFAEGMVSSGRRIELQAADVALGGSLVLLVLFSRSQQARPARLSSDPRSHGGAV
jgi:hypothetical protein